MSKKVIENSELQMLTQSPTYTNEDESQLFTTMVGGGMSKYPTATSVVLESSGTPLPQNEKRKIEKTHSGPMAGTRIPSFRLSTPNSQGYTRVTYSNEKKQDKKPERPSSINTPQKKDSTSIFSRPSKSSFKNSPLISLRIRDEKKPAGPSQIHSKSKDNLSRMKGLTPEGVSRLRGGLVGLRSARGGYSPLRVMDRPTQHHTFTTDAADVRQIEKKLLQLMDDFETGNLRAFGKDSKLRQMEEIREQQEKLARLHFDVGAEQELYPPLSEDGLRISEENMRTLMEKLAHLSESIENLHTNTHGDRKPSTAEWKTNTASSLHPPSSDAISQMAQSSSHQNSLTSHDAPHHSQLVHSALHHKPIQTSQGSSQQSSQMPPFLHQATLTVKAKEQQSQPSVISSNTNSTSINSSSLPTSISSSTLPNSSASKLNPENGTNVTKNALNMCTTSNIQKSSSSSNPTNGNSTSNQQMKSLKSPKCQSGQQAHSPVSVGTVPENESGKPRLSNQNSHLVKIVSEET